MEREAERNDSGISQWRTSAMLSVPVPPLRKAYGLDRLRLRDNFQVEKIGIGGG